MSEYVVCNGTIEDVCFAEIEAESFDAVLCDPPYGLSFMGKKWDYQVPSVDLWSAVLRVLKPGAPILAFGGTRTYHRMVCNLEDAGAEIRDQIAWIYGSGFPKSQNISIALDKAQGLDRPVVGPNPNGRPNMVGLDAFVLSPRVDAPLTSNASEVSEQWSGYGTALKPAIELICLARKPLIGTMAENVSAHGVGGLNIDGTRIEGLKRTPGYATEEKAEFNPTSFGMRGHTEVDVNGGRWPANVILDEAAGAELDAEVGNRPGMSGGGKHKADYAGGMFGAIDSTETARGDNGGPSRFFYCAKASRKERELGCGKNVHPTVKPLSLTKYLATLIKPPSGGRILVPFSGSGSEMIGCILAGWAEVVGIERDPEYVKIAEARLAHYSKEAK